MVIDKEKYTSHIKDQEKIFEMRRILDKIEIVINSHTCQSTDFLDPYERYLAKSILNRFLDINYIENGGIIEAERQIIDIFPHYYSIDNIPINISALRLEGNLGQLTHRDFLGSILNLGINRSKIGDILVHADYTDIIVKNEIADFLLVNHNKVKNQNTALNNIKLECLVPVESNYSKTTKTLSSYRVDVCISAIYNLSRQESMNIIKSGNVKINWEPVDKPSEEIVVGDLISVRKYGRSVFHSIEGISRKGKIRANIRILL